MRSVPLVPMHPLSNDAPTSTGVHRSTPGASRRRRGLAAEERGVEPRELLSRIALSLASDAEDE